MARTRAAALPSLPRGWPSHVRSGGRAIRRAGATPCYVVTDKGRETSCWPFKSWRKARETRPRFGAVGQNGSITIVERFIRSLKSECTPRILAPFRIEAMRPELGYYATRDDKYRTPAEADEELAA